MRIKSELLLKLRLEKGWTQEEVADRIGIDARTYRRYERTEIGVSHRAAQYEILRCIAAVFSLPGPETLLAENAEWEPGTPLLSEPPPRRAAQAVAKKPVQPPDAPFFPEWYVHRDREEKEAQNKLRSAVAPVVLQGPHLYGKGYLLSYLLQQLTGSSGYGPCRLLRINMASLAVEDLRSLDALLSRIGRAALELVDCQESEQRLAKAWQRPGSPASKLSRIMKHEILEKGQLLLTFEKVERLHGCAFQDDLFALLRGWAESGVEEPWSRLRMILTVSTEPTLLESLDHSSFFALASPIRLGSLTPEQVAQMASLYQLTAKVSTLAQLDAMLGGHPYLVRLAFYQSVVREVPLEELLRLPHSEGLFLHHLKSLHRFLEENQLFSALGAVITDPSCPLAFQDYCRLYSHGLIYEERPSVFRLRCGLYEQYFKPRCNRLASS